MGSSGPSLLAVVEFLSHTGLKAVYERLGYEVVQEFTVRKAIARLRQRQPTVIAADFYFQPDFRDRVSNLESLLAAAQRLPGSRILVYYDLAHQGALDKVRQRFRIDAALGIPVRESELCHLLASWASQAAEAPR